MLSSAKLAKFFKKMLAVGNVLNEGTQKGDAKGIRLDSMLKMVSTKGELAAMIVVRMLNAPH